MIFRILWFENGERRRYKTALGGASTSQGIKNEIFEICSLAMNQLIFGPIFMLNTGLESESQWLRGAGEAIP